MHFERLLEPFAVRLGRYKPVQWDQNKSKSSWYKIDMPITMLKDTGRVLLIANLFDRLKDSKSARFNQNARIISKSHVATARVANCLTDVHRRLDDLRGNLDKKNRLFISWRRILSLFSSFCWMATCWTSNLWHLGCERVLIERRRVSSPGRHLQAQHWPWLQFQRLQ